MALVLGASNRAAVVVAFSAVSLICAHNLLEKVHHIYCRSNVFLIYLYGDSAYCNTLHHATKSLEAFAISLLGSVFSTTKQLAA